MASFNYMTGTIHWAKILGDPVPNFNRDGNEWTFDFTPDADGMKLIRELKIDNKLKDKKDDRGKFIAFKQKETRADGTPNFPITVVDARNRPWDPKIVGGKATNLIGNGSKVEVKFKVVEYGVGKPVGVYVQAVRVLDPKEYVRQEFAPLPEDSEYLGKFAEDEFPEVNEPMLTEGDDAPLDGDVLEG